MKRIISILLMGILILSGLGTSAISIRSPSSQQSSSLDEYDMVIIAPEQFSSEIQQLIDHKNSVGVSSFLKTTKEIYNEYDGVDNPEKIKLFIKDAIEQYGITYVLIIGDPSHVPIRKTAVSWNYFGDLVVPDVLTDLYYSDIYNETGSLSLWDTNHDGIYSEIRIQ